MGESAEKFDLSSCRVCVIRNRKSGKGEAAKTHAIQEALQDKAAEFAFRETDRGDQLPALARRAVEDGFELIVAAGGDGTQSAVAGAVAGSAAIMGVLPGGTFNYFARDLGVGETIEEGLATLQNARVRAVDVGEIEDLVFINNISLGAYPHILKTREGIYKRWGRSRLAAYWSVLVALRRLRNPMRLTAIVDGQSHDFTTALLFVAHSAYQLDSVGLEGADAIRAGNFAVLIAKARQPLPLLRSALRLAFGFSAKDSDFDLIVTDRLTIDTGKRRQLVAHDGEKTRMSNPLHLKVRRGALKVLVPAQDPETASDAAA